MFAAAAAEFAARGYAGANVDRIARAARLNKAMIYYHFKSKAALYREILRDMFGAVRAARRRGRPRRTRRPEDKIRAYIDAIAAEAEARPHFPPIWLREIAEGGGARRRRHARLRPRRARRARRDHRRRASRAGRFRRRIRSCVQGGIIAPLMFFLATAPLRQKIARAGVDGIAAISRDMVVAHIQRLTLAQLEGKIA